MRVAVRHLLTVLCGLAIAFDAVAAELETVRIGLTRQPSSGPLYIAVARGYFQAAAIDPKVRFFATDEAIRGALAAGQLDVGVSSLTASFYRDAAADGIKIIASQSSDQPGFPMHALLISKKAREAGFRSVKDLPHKRIGMSAVEAAAHYTMVNVATRFKIDPGEMNFVWLGTATRELEALSRGDVDAVVLPYGVARQSARKGDALLRLSDLAVSQQGIVFASSRFIQSKHALLAKLVHAYQRGAGEYDLNFQQYDDGGDFIPGPRYAEYLDLIARESHVASKVLTMTKTYCDKLARPDAADIDSQISFWKRLARLDKGVVAADLLDLSFLAVDIEQVR